MASAVTNRLSRDDFRKAKELEELRKTGAAPPELDAEGRIINPHIPQYISSAPWYYHSTRPGLKHQYLSKYKPAAPAPSIHAPNKVVIVEERKRQSASSSSASSAASAACDNCGSLTHSAKDCLERPRKRNARHGGDVVGRDERLLQAALDYDGKRDRWKGYDSADYSRVVERYEKAELERKKRKLQELEEAYRQDKKREEEQQAEAKDAGTAAGGGSAVSAEASSVAELGKASSDDVVSESKDGKEGKASAAASAGDVKESELDKLRRLKKEKRLHKLRKKIAQATAASAPTSASSSSSSAAAAASLSSSDTDSDTDDSGGSDEDVKDYGEVITRMDAKARITVRNLRIREDTAKYLRNLHPDSAHYDPKTRSMRQSPYEGRSAEDVLYAGDNFIRSSGDVKEIKRLQQYVWDNAEKQQLEAEAGQGGAEGGVEVHAVALPSAAERLYAAHRQQQEQQKAQSRNAILHRYGGEEHLVQPPLPSMLQHSDEYAEYDDAGRQVRGPERQTPRSKYVEDELEDGHSAIWGSFYDRDSRRWGYACCHITVRHAICIGEMGRSLGGVLGMERGGGGGGGGDSVKEEERKGGSKVDRGLEAAAGGDGRGG